MQSIILVGRVSLLNDIKEFDGDKKLLIFSVGDSFMDKLTYFTCYAWNNQATNIKKFFKVGDPIALKLRYTTEIYKDANGQKKNKSYFIVESFSFFEKPKNKDDINSNDNGLNVDDDELPF